MLIMSVYLLAEGRQEGGSGIYGRSDRHVLVKQTNLWGQNVPECAIDFPLNEQPGRTFNRKPQIMVVTEIQCEKKEKKSG